MSRPVHVEPVKLIASVFSSDETIINKTISDLSGIFGSTDYTSELMPFLYTDYYDKEMGAQLKRRFVSFEDFIRPESLPDVKLRTNDLELKNESKNRRIVNIDPGYVSHAHLILATGKGFTHRPYLRDGIYADLTLMFRNKEFHPLPWTYPDYADEKTRGIFRRIREKYVLQMKSFRNNN
jgi:hypothetical protein